MNLKVGKAVPMLNVSDMEEALTFWRDGLGFEVNGTYDDNGKPCWAYLRQGDTAIMLTLEPEMEADDLEGQGVILYFYPEDVRGLHAALSAKGLEVSEIETAFYGMEEFECIAPGGHPLWFGQESIDPTDNNDE